MSAGCVLRFLWSDRLQLVIIKEKVGVYNCSTDGPQLGECLREVGKLSGPQAAEVKASAAHLPG